MKTFLLYAFLFLLLLCAGFLLFLPFLADTYLLPKIIASVPFPEKNISLSRISPWKLKGSVTISENGKNILSLPSVVFNYRPSSLLNGKIDSIVIEGGSLSLNLDNNTNKKKYSGSLQAAKQQNEISPLLLPIDCDTLIIKNSSISVHLNKKEHQLAINGQLAAHFKELGPWDKQFISATARIQSTGSLVLLAEASLQPKDEGYELLYTTSTPDISDFAYLFHELKKFSPAGQLDLSGRVLLDNLAQISELQATANLSRFSSTFENIALSDISPQKPVTITVQKNNKRIYSEIKNLSITSPQESSVDMQGEYHLKTGAFNGKGHLALPAIPTPVNFSFSGEKTVAETRVKFSSSAESFSIGKNPDLFFSQPSMDGELSIRGRNTSGRVNGSVGELTLPSRKTRIQDITFSLPLQFPLTAESNASGTFKIGSINYDTIPVGSVTGDISIQSAGILFSTHITSTYGPDLQAQCSGTITTDRHGKLACRLPATHINSESFPPFIELPSELSIEGTISAEAEFSSFNEIGKGSFHLKFNDGTVTLSENKLSSIDISLTFPDLPLLHSAPSQLCTIGTIESGNINFSDAKINFRIENPLAIFIEKSNFSWCGGNVESGSFRLSSTGQNLETTLYCDRLNFTQLLSQFGIEDTEGEGSLNGKLPIFLSKENITIDNGFLFSTPGNGGIVRFNNTTQLRQGMGAIDQTPYLDYSMQALENFSYNWTKLTFNSQEDDLLIKMQIDGKPAAPLPFGYRKGQIVPTKKGPGLQHPILLDVNFRLPMTHLFQYGKNMQSIMENM